MPAQLHQLVKAVSRQGEPQPHENVQVEKYLEQKPKSAVHRRLERRRRRRQHHPQNTSQRQTQQADGGQEALLNLHRLFGSAIETVACKHQHEQRRKGIKKIERIDVWKWPQPTAEEDCRGDRAHHDHVDILGQEVERPAEAAVFGHVAGHQLRFGLGQIKGRTIGLGDGRHQVDEEPDRRQEHEPHARPRLDLDNAVHGKRARQEQTADQRHPRGGFIADQLRRAAQRAQQRVMAIRGPATKNNSENPHRADAQNKKQTDVEVGNLELGTNRHCRQRQQGRGHRNQRRGPEKHLVRVLRDDVFLYQQLDSIGDRLQKAVRPYAHGAQARLHIRHHLALD